MNATNTTSPSLSPILAARMLSAALGEAESTWAMRLANGRRKERHSPIPWCENEHGNPLYSAQDVQRFIDEEFTKRAATGVPAAAPAAVSSKATAVPDSEAENPFVRVLWNAGNAQGMFSLSLEAATQLAEKLLSAAKLASLRVQAPAPASTGASTT